MTAAAVASVTIISGLWKVMRSPQEMLEKGPSSAARDHARVAARSQPRAMVGRERPMSIGARYAAAGSRSVTGPTTTTRMFCGKHPFSGASHRTFAAEGSGAGEGSAEGAEGEVDDPVDVGLGRDQHRHPPL